MSISSRPLRLGLAAAFAAAMLASAPAFAMPLGGDAAAHPQARLVPASSVEAAGAMAWMDAPAAPTAQEVAALAREVEALRIRLAELERRLEDRAALRTAN